MATWTNSDGLRVKFGTDQAKGALVGVPCTYGAIKQVTAIIEASRLSLSGGKIDPDANVVIPAGSYMHRATLMITETFVSAGTNGTLDLGLITAADSYTGGDEDGIDAAIAEAALVQGAVIACDGALIGFSTDKDTGAASTDLYLSYDVDTSLFTAGKALLVIEYVAPMYPDQGVD